MHRNRATAGKVSEVVITTLAPGHVVTAVRNGSGNLQLDDWFVLGDEVVRRVGFTAPILASDVAITTQSHPQVVTAVRAGSGDLQLNAFFVLANEVESSGGNYVNAGSISKVAIASSGSAEVVAAVRNGSGNLQLILWR